MVAPQRTRCRSAHAVGSARAHASQPAAAGTLRRCARSSVAWTRCSGSSAWLPSTRSGHSPKRRPPAVAGARGRAGHGTARRARAAQARCWSRLAPAWLKPCRVAAAGAASARVARLAAGGPARAHRACPAPPGRAGQLLWPCQPSSERHRGTAASGLHAGKRALPGLRLNRLRPTRWGSWRSYAAMSRAWQQLADCAAAVPSTQGPGCRKAHSAQPPSACPPFGRPGARCAWWGSASTRSGARPEAPRRLSKLHSLVLPEAARRRIATKPRQRVPEVPRHTPRRSLRRSAPRNARRSRRAGAKRRAQSGGGQEACPGLGRERLLPARCPGLGRERLLPARRGGPGSRERAG
jgi:hypothetical protein